MALTQEDLGQIGEIVTHAIHGAVSGLATKDELEVGLDSVKSEIRRVRSMLEEDYFAEAGRVTRISRRLARTRAELKQHIADTVPVNQAKQSI